MNRRLAIAGIVLVSMGPVHIRATNDSQKKHVGIRILDASFGDQLAHKTCVPNLSLCKGITECTFTVGDLCEVNSAVKNLEVTWDCGDGTAKKARAAAKGTPITLDCKK